MQAIVDRVEEDPTHLFAVTQGTHTLLSPIIVFRECSFHTALFMTIRY